VSVELRPPRVAAPPDVVEVWSGADAVGVARLAVTAGVARAELVLDATVPFGLDVVAGALRALVSTARVGGADTIELDTASLVVRHVARRLWFAGGLRRPLRRPTSGPGPAPWRSADDVAAEGADAHGADGYGTTGFGAAGQGAGGDAAGRAAELAGALCAWGVDARPRRPPGGVGRTLRRLSLGVSATLEVEIPWAAGRAVVMGAPDRPDLMPEAVAVAADTTRAVLRRFVEQAPAVRTIRFDRSNRGLVTGRYAGSADRSAGTIHLNAAYVAAGPALDDAHRRAAQALAGRAATGAPPSLAERLTYGALGPSARATAPYTGIDTTMAHELWHQLESAWESRHYGEAIALRRGVGAALGVETLERALKGNAPNAPQQWRSAFARLAQEVSPYATSSADEATAEMFKLWWCRVGAVSPVVARFGELVDSLIPPPPGG